MLALVGLVGIDVLPGTPATVTVPESSTLREAMEKFISGADSINIGTRGHLTFDALQDVIAKTRAAAK